MPRSLTVVLIVSGVMVSMTVAAFLFMLYMMQAGSGLGTIGVMILVVVGSPTLITVMVTVGLWMFRRNRTANESISFLNSESGSTN